MSDSAEHDRQQEAMATAPPARRSAWTAKQKIIRLLWGTIGRLGWQFASLRPAMLRLFGGTVGSGCRLARRIEITIPWNISLGDDVVQSALGEVGFLPLLVLAAKICPPGIEGALFAALMSIFNLGGIVSTEAGALLTDAFHVSETDFSNLSPLIVTCAASSLLPLFFLGWVRGAEDSGDDDVTA